MPIGSIVKSSFSQFKQTVRIFQMKLVFKIYNVYNVYTSINARQVSIIRLRSMSESAHTQIDVMQRDLVDESFASEFRAD